jgi:hypothetical protein
MSKLVCFVLLITCITPSIFSPGQQTDSERPDTPQAREFFNHLQQMLRDNDRKGIAGLVEYPMLTTLNGKKIHIPNRTIFLKDFDQVFDRGIRCAILESTDKNVWGNSHGFTIEHANTIGTIWFDGLRNSNESSYVYRLMTVNNGPLNKCDAH